MGIFDSSNTKAKPLKCTVLKAHILDGPLILHPGAWVWMPVRQQHTGGIYSSYEALERRGIVVEFYNSRIKLKNLRTKQYVVRDGDPVAKLLHV
jgi:hypothetical protein